MEKIGVFLGILLCFCAGAVLCQDGTKLTVSNDIMMKPGGTAHLNCVGHNPDVYFYIKNKAAWEFKDKNGKVSRLMEGFYVDQNDGYAKRLIDAGRLAVKSEPIKDASNNQIGTFFNVTLKDVQFSDDGEYTCAIYEGINEANLLNNATVRLTVVSPVTKLRLELHDDQGPVSSRESFIEEDTEVKVSPGSYKAKCTAEGSNPEPMVGIYYNEKMLQGEKMDKRITDGAGPTYTSEVMIKELELKSMNVEQVLMCEANIAGNYYNNKKAGIKLRVEIEKPNFMCGNLTTSPNERYRKMECDLIAKPGGATPVCRNVFWKFGKNGTIMENEKFSDPKRVYDVMQTNCKPIENGVEVSLTIYVVREIHMKTQFYVVYGVGDDAEQFSIPIYYKKTSGASMLTSITLLSSFLMAVVSRLVARHL